MELQLAQYNLVGDQPLVEVRPILGFHAVGIAKLDGVPTAKGDDQGAAYLDIVLRIFEPSAVQGLPASLEVGQIQRVASGSPIGVAGLPGSIVPPKTCT